MINKLVEKIKKTGAPIVVGLDPMLSYVPEHIQKKSFDEYERHWKVPQMPSGSTTSRSSTARDDLIPAVKPQIAMYEQFGVEGLKAFQKTVDYCHEKDLVVIGDVKRGDIGSTSAAYATGHLGKVEVGRFSSSGYPACRLLCRRCPGESARHGSCCEARHTVRLMKISQP